MIRTYYQISVEKKAATGRVTHVRLSYFGKVFEFTERWLAHEKQKELGIESYSSIVEVKRRVDLKAGEFCEMCGRTSRLAVAQKPDDKLITACGLCRQGLKELRAEQCSNEKRGQDCIARFDNTKCNGCIRRMQRVSEEAQEGKG